MSLSLDQVTLTLGGRTLVRSLSLNLKPGEVIVETPARNYTRADYAELLRDAMEAMVEGGSPFVPIAKIFNHDIVTRLYDCATQ